MSPTRDQVMQRVAEEIANSFGIRASEITAATTALDVDGWDSVRHTVLLMQLEEVFGMEFPDDKIVSMKDVGELADTICSVLAAQSPDTKPT